MFINPDFKLAEVAGEYFFVPVGDSASSFKGIVALSEATGFLLKQLNSSTTKDDLETILVQEYNIDQETAEMDVENLLNRLREFGILKD